jgi:hypothetical protein
VDDVKLSKPAEPQQRKRGRWMLWLVLLVCASPLIASYFTYYVIKPEKRNNYGTLIDQRAHPVPAMATTTLDGKPAGAGTVQGQVGHADGGARRLRRTPAASSCSRCASCAPCRARNGPHRARLADHRQGAARHHDHPRIRRHPHAARRRRDGRGWLPADRAPAPADHIYMIDPLGHLMMRFPKDPEPRKVYKDIYKLLKASSVG